VEEEIIDNENMDGSGTEMIRGAGARFDDNFVDDNDAVEDVVTFAHAPISAADMEASFAEIISAAMAALGQKSIDISDTLQDSVERDPEKSDDVNQTRVSWVKHSTPNRKAGSVDDEDLLQRRARIIRRLNRMHPPEQLVNGYSRSGFSRAAFK
jgi:hypothetical protein